MKPLVQVQNLMFSYRMGKNWIPILHGINFEIYPGEFVAIQGPSGSGKSTLLYVLGGLNPPSGGRVLIGGHDLSTMSDSELAAFRNRNIGFIFQQFHLLAKATVLENILLPSHYPVEWEQNPDLALSSAKRWAVRLGLGDRLHHGSQELSGGQQQRVAIARALLNEPFLILADEPTGNLDTQNAKLVIEELRNLKQQGKTIVLITHDKDIAAQADRTIRIQDGLVIEQTGSVAGSKINSQILRPQIWIPNYFNFLKKLIPTARSNIFRNKIRSALTMIGISIGVAAVLMTITLGTFAKDKILSGYAEMGIQTLNFWGNRNWNLRAQDRVDIPFNGFSWEKDIEPLLTIFPEIQRISPVMTSWRSQVDFGGKTIDQDVRIIGSNEQHFAIVKRQLARGRSLSRIDVDNKLPVCIVGSEIAEKLFSNVEPLSEILRVSNDNRQFGCRIIGVAASLKSRHEGRRPDLEVYLPYTFYQVNTDHWWDMMIRDLVLEIHDGYDVEKTGRAIQGFFERKYGKSGRFRVDADSILIGQMNRFLNIFSVLLGSIALTCLAVGGIGIANMMLVSVSERYREIGLRKAIGATNKSIRYQFLLESLLLCGLAGFVGLGVGFIGYETIIWGGSKVIPKFEFQWVFDLQAVLLSTVAIVAVGIFSGLTPALRAEKLSPIEALRSE